LKPAPGKVGQADVQPASFQTLTDATSQTAPAGAARPKTTTPAPSAQPTGQQTTQVAQQPPVAPASPVVQNDGSQSATSPSELSVSVPPSEQATAAAATAAADLKTLQQQIAAFPPSGKSDGGMPSSEFLGQTYDLFGGQSVTPKPRSPETIRRRARSRWRHLPPRSP
jgi:hypothetical protein